MDMSLEDRINANQRDKGRNTTRGRSQNQRGGTSRNNDRHNRDRRYNGRRGDNGDGSGAPSSYAGVNKSRDRNRGRYEAAPADQDWVHDKWDDQDEESMGNTYDYSNTYNNGGSGRLNGRGRNGNNLGSTIEGPVKTRDGLYGYRIKIFNLPETVTEKELEDVFSGAGHLIEARIVWVRDRSSGRALVVYATREEALHAVHEYDGELAKGQKIRVEYDYQSEQSRPRAPQRALGRSLEDRITLPTQKSEAPTADSRIDRYVPADRRTAPIPAGGRRRGRGRANERRGGNARPTKTREELDAEMEDYFGGNEGAGKEEVPAAPAAAPEEEMTIDFDL